MRDISAYLVLVINNNIKIHPYPSEKIRVTKLYYTITDFKQFQGEFGQLNFTVDLEP